LWVDLNLYRKFKSGMVERTRDYAVTEHFEHPIYFSADSKYLIALVTIGETDRRYGMDYYWHNLFKVFDITTGRLVRTYEIKGPKEMFKEVIMC